MILEFLLTYMHVRDVFYEPEKKRFVFITRKSALVFGIIWSAVFLIAGLIVLQFVPLYELIQALFYVGTHHRLLHEYGVTSFANGIICIVLFAETVMALRQVYHMLIEVTVVGERGVIRRNSRFFNSTALLDEISYSFAGSSLKIRKGKTLWLSLSGKTEYLTELLEVLSQVDFEGNKGDGLNAM